MSTVATLAMVVGGASGALVSTAQAAPAPVGQGFTVTASDLSFILDQIKIAEHHAVNATDAAPCAGLLGTGPDQVPSPLIGLGLRTVDGSCNNLQPGQEKFGAADQTFPRLAKADFRPAEPITPAFPVGPPGGTSYAQTTGSVVDSQPRMISNLIVDQTSSNPAAVAAAGFPVRTQGNDGVFPCAGISDVQTLLGPPAGDFTLSFGGSTTGTLPAGIAPGALQTALNTIVPAPGVKVTGGPLPATFTITFKAHGGQPALTSSDPALEIATITAGTADETGCVPPGETMFIPNVTTDVGLSPPYNSLFTIFGQFFDHGLDKITNGGNGTVFVPLKADDPLIVGPDGVAGTDDDPQPGDLKYVDPNNRFMVLTRGTVVDGPGPDRVLGTPDDTHHEALNTDSPWVDLSQAYTSHPAHQVFLREYTLDAQNHPQSTGRLLSHVDGQMANWADVKAESAAKLGLKLVDTDVNNIPMIAADPYGNFVPGPARGLPQYVTTVPVDAQHPTGIQLLEGNIAAPVQAPANAKRIDTAFLNDIAHSAAPVSSQGVVLTPDANTTTGKSLDPMPAGEYDDELLGKHVIAGDGRANENIGLTAIHTVFEHEHNRLVDYEQQVLNANPALLAAYRATGAGTFSYGERLFQAARFVTEMEYQHLVFEEFARKVQPAINPFNLFAFSSTDTNPAIKAEFAHAVYRFGHSMLDETIPRTNADGTHNDIKLLDGFLNPEAFKDVPAGDVTGAGGDVGSAGAGSIIMGLSDQVGNELDEFVSDTLRNNLLGLPLDLASLNMTRARSEGIPSLNNVRKKIFAETNDGQLAPYTDWVDFGLHLKHPESLVNFVAAYGKHPTVIAATTAAAKRAAAQAIVDPQQGGLAAPGDAADFMNSTGAWQNTGAGASITGLDDVDLWVGGLAEMTNLFGGLLGTTFNYVFELQLTQLQDGDRLYYLNRTPGMNLRTQLEGNSFAELVMRNTTAQGLKADSFATADCKFDLSKLTGAGSPGDENTGVGSVNDDPASECNENALLIRKGNGRIEYRPTNSVDTPGINGQSVYNGTADGDLVAGGNDNDTFRGNGGVDLMEGKGGDDDLIGGDGNDRITDLGGDDVLKGGPGNDALDGGIGLDLLLGGDGNDVTAGGANTNVHFAGPGNDIVIAGQGADEVDGDSGDDWQEGGDQTDLLQGDSGSLFFDDHNKPGNDVLIGQVGDDDYDMEGGDDIGVAGPGIEKNAGAAGWDWSIGLNDPQPQDADLALPVVGVPLPINQVRDRFNEVESLSGWRMNDVLRGDDVIPSQITGGGFIGCDALDQNALNRIPGLDALVPTLTVDPAPIIAGSATRDCPLTGNVWGEGNILLGGDGADLIEGRGGDDIIDGDKYVNVRLSVRDHNDLGTEIGSTDLMTHPYGAASGNTLQADVFNGTVDPGDIVVVREVLPTPAGASNIDTALFSGPRSDYTFNVNDAVGPNGQPQQFAVTDNTGTDGTDLLSGIEFLQFSDVRVPVTPLLTSVNRAATGGLVIDGTISENFALTVAPSPAIADADGIASAILLTWQSETAPGNWVSVGTGSGFTPGNPEVGHPLRVVATFTDALGVHESITSVATVPVVNVEDPIQGLPALSTASPQQGVLVTATQGTVTDLDGLPAFATWARQWQRGSGVNWTDIPGPQGTAASYTPTAADIGQSLRLRVNVTDLHGTGYILFSPQTAAVLAAPTVPAAPTNLQLTRAVGAVQVTWTAPNSGGSPITAYTVRAFNAVNALAQTVTVPGGTTTASVPLAAGSYTFDVLATNLIGDSQPSTRTGTSSPAVVPAVPTGVTVARTPGVIRVGWTASANTGGVPLTRYEVRVLNAGGNAVAGQALRTAGAGATSVQVTGLTPGTAYRFQVRAVNGVGASAFSTPSAVPGVVFATVPDAPVNGTPVRGTAGGALTFTANWTPPASTGGSDITGYQVFAVRMNGAGGNAAPVGAPIASGVLAATARSFTFTVTTPAGTNYRFQVEARNVMGTGARSARSTNVVPR